MKAVFPAVVNGSVIIDTYSYPHYMPSIDKKVFSKRTLIGKCSEEQFKMFLGWLPVANRTLHDYYVWSVVDPSHRELLSAYDCLDFVWSAFEALADIGVVFDPGVHCHRTMVYLHVHGMEEVNYEDVNWKKEIVRFYQTFQFKGQSLLEILKHLAEFDPDPKFVFGYNKFFWVSLRFPYLSTKYMERPLPVRSS